MSPYTLAMNDPFQILELPRQYDLNESLLQQQFVALSAANHPDRFSDPVQQAEASEKSAAINEAYALLKDPVLRAQVLLKLIAGELSEDRDTLPPDFLMEVMEVRESMEQAVEQSDTAKLDELRTWASQERADHLDRIAVTFDAHMNSTTTDTTPDLLIRQVQQDLNVLRYLERMLEQMP